MRPEHRRVDAAASPVAPGDAAASPQAASQLTVPSINIPIGWKSGFLPRCLAKSSPAVSVMFRQHTTAADCIFRRQTPIMRQERVVQASLFDLFATHEISKALKQISQWLDQHRPLLRLVSNDLRRDGVRETGRRGLPAEAVLRCALLKQYRQLSYEELAFRLEEFSIVSRLRAAADGLDAEEGGAVFRWKRPGYRRRGQERRIDAVHWVRLDSRFGTERADHSRLPPISLSRLRQTVQ